MPGPFLPPRHSNPPKILNVAEKPSVARALAGAFHRIPGSRESAPMRREAAQIFSHDNVCFPYIFSQGNNNVAAGGGNHNQRQQQQQPHQMITTSVRGHLASIEFGPDYGWSRCDPLSLFEAPIEIIYKEDMQPLKRMLERLSKTVDAVILWLDCDREGEAIGDEVMQVCVGGNPRLRPYVYRARFSTVLDGEIQRALSSLGRLNDHFVQAVNARSEMDLRTGAAFTRFQTLRLQKKFHLPGSGGNNNNGGGSSGVVSYGPCQFPTLGFVVERWARIETFAPEDFWFLELTLRIQQQEYATAIEATTTTSSSSSNNNNKVRPIVFTWRRNRLYDRMIAMALYESCMEDQTAIVTQLSGRPKNKWRPVPLATIELQKRASRYLHIGSETLMSAAEELYQQGYISYPRTETERFRPEFQHRPLVEDFARLNADAGPFSSYANRLLNEDGFQNPRAGQHDDQAHPPITPCKAVNPSTIDNPTQRNVYILVVKHYLACCSRDAVGRETTLTVKIASEEFTAKGLMIEQKNWLEIYEPWERWSTGQGELPTLQVGSRVTPSSLLMKEGTTTAPQPISEPELITLMDKCGIGTDATIAQHISTIQDRDYARKDQSQRFLPTPLGIALVEGYNSMGYQLNKPDLRRETEHECNLVANGQKTKDDIVDPILSKMKSCYLVATREAHKLDEAMARHFQRIGASNDTTILQRNFSECGTCRTQMSLKQERSSRGGGDRRKLLYCNTCQIGYMMPRKGQIRPKTDENNPQSLLRCEICNFQVIAIARGDGYEGNGYNLCPKCYNDPPPEHGGLSGGGMFACFACAHPTCALAGGTRGGDIEVFGCPFCRELGNRGGKVLLRKNTRGYVLSCSNYSSREKCSYTIWLPKASQEVSVSDTDDNVCTQCSTNGTVKKISFIWRPGGVPPHLGRETTACILCDTQFREDVQIQTPRLYQVRTNNNRQHSGRTGGGRGSNGRFPRSESSSNGVRGRDMGAQSRSRSSGSAANIHVCYRCNQPGHYANACPTTRNS